MANQTYAAMDVFVVEGQSTKGRDLVCYAAAGDADAACLGDAFAIVVGEDVAVFTEAEETGELGVLHGWLLVKMGGWGGRRRGREAGRRNLNYRFLRG